MNKDMLRDMLAIIGAVILMGCVSWLLGEVWFAVPIAVVMWVAGSIAYLGAGVAVHRWLCSRLDGSKVPDDMDRALAVLFWPGLAIGLAASALARRVEPEEWQ